MSETPREFVVTVFVYAFRDSTRTHTQTFAGSNPPAILLADDVTIIASQRVTLTEGKFAK